MSAMSKSRLWTLIAALAFALGVVVAAGCGGGDETTAGGGGGGGDIPAEISVGSDIPYAPFEFGKSPPYEGYDVDIVSEIGKRIGAKMNFQDTAFPTIFRDLAQGKFDMVAS